MKRTSGTELETVKIRIEPRPKNDSSTSTEATNNPDATISITNP